MELDDVRKRSERSFHDARLTAARDPRVVTRPFYRIVEESHAYYRRLIYGDCNGRHVLEYGCGPGSEAFELAKRKATVNGIDISPVAVEIAAAKARHEGVGGLAFTVMDAERTTFEDSTFDLVAGSGILHHLKLNRAYGEIARVLKPDGRAVFIEPLGHNPAINWYRRRTPMLRTPDEHPLLLADLSLAKRYFNRVSVRYYHLSTLAAICFGKTPLFESARRTLGAIDRALFATLPALRKYAWMCVIEASNKRLSKGPT